MSIQFGRDICGNLATAEQREWLVTNGIGGYACGTVAGLLTRHYHGLLVAALQPPLGRTLLLAKLDETVYLGDSTYELSVDRWADSSVSPHGYQHIERFHLDGTTPVWTFACADALLQKRIWMQPGSNTTYIQYTLKRSQEPISLSLKALVNYRDHHNSTTGEDWWMRLELVNRGVKVAAFEQATPLYLLTDLGQAVLEGTWYVDYELAVERDRGLPPQDDHFHAATFQAYLEPGQSLTLVASTEDEPELEAEKVWFVCQQRDRELLQRYADAPPGNLHPPAWIQQLVLAADQFVVDRPLYGDPNGKTIIAGYPWFGDWGRDTAISLPGLAVATGRPEIAQQILRTFACYLDQGMLPNLFPDVGETPGYNTVDAILWYFEAVWAYYAATRDREFLKDLFPALVETIEWHQRGTRYNIHLDASDGLIYAGEAGLQLTWMDAKIDNWVVTPRIGKPIEVNALWYNALCIMAQFAAVLEVAPQPYEQLAQQTREGFQRYWSSNLGYCYDVLDGPEGNDATLRPNQIFAVSLPSLHLTDVAALLSFPQQRAVVNSCSRMLLTSYGLRSLAPDHPQYCGRYGGTPEERDSSYHQGPVWGWLIGPFVQAHLKVYRDRKLARSFLYPLAQQLQAGCVGTLGEIFDGDPPMQPRGAFAQAWTVAEVLRTWDLINQEKP